MTDVFTPLSLTVSQVFINGDPLYKIPNYQRPYSWNDDQVDRLWDDLFTAFENNKENKEIDANYFLGSLIVVPQDKGFEDVVDGQQRLTTMMILFNVVKSIFPNINKEINAIDNPNVIKIGKINNCIKNTNDISRLRLYTHESHQNDFENYVLSNNEFSGLKKPNKKEIANSPKFRFINTAYIFHQKLIQMSEDEAGNFINYLFNQVKIIKISCSNRAFAIKLFQVLNDRGLDLSASDLIKSILLASLKDDLKHGAFVADWQASEQIAENLDVGLTELFTFYEYYLLGKNPKKSLVDELENLFQGKDANKVISDFKKFVSTYDTELFNENEDKLLFSFWYLTWTTYWKTVLLTAIHSEYPELEKLKVSFRRFYYLNWIAGKTLSSIKQTSFNLISAIKEKKSMVEIDEMFNTKIENDEIIASVLRNLSGNTYFEAWVKPLYILIEYNQTDNDYATFITWDRNLQLEHIMPQTFSKKESWNHISEEIGNDLLHCAGNLTLLSSKKNIEAQNYSFEDKINIYQGLGKKQDKTDGITSFRICQKIVDDYNSKKYNQKWNEIAIIDRYNWFIKEVGEILKINTDSIKKEIH
jgi:uncharacterized protein with ParB-like and HNH nuclease domain